jgi:FAD/FMN-containing dehydrogenase
MVVVTSWGRLSKSEHQVTTLTHKEEVAGAIAGKTPGICFGMGRSYGDVCLNPDGHLWLTQGLDRFISFDPESGVLHCEAGVLLRDIQRVVVPQGWMLPVTPGTQLITVGGAIANDVHGKNHHVMGTFGEHVLSLSLQRSDGQRLECSANQNADWLRATVAGLGLTGIIVSARLQLRKIASPLLDTETLTYGNLEEFFAIAADSESDWEHTVSWIDCLAAKNSRGIFLRANHRQSTTDTGSRTSQPSAGSLTMPLTPPVSLVNRLSLKPFNAAYYALNARNTGPGVTHYETFFYPLDKILHWNRMYGRKGFYQYQCVVPSSTARDALAAMLTAIATSGEGSFLAVLKTFGNRQSAGLLSFPMPGATLALDFPNRGKKTHQLFDALDIIVSDAGGRLYPAKDARMPRTLFETGYPALGSFHNFRDPGISSAMSRRLMGT